MKAFVLLAALLAGRLTLATMAWAQDAASGMPPVQPHVEVGVSAGAIWFEPTVGLLTSVRASKRSSIEGGATMTPAFRAHAGPSAGAPAHRPTRRSPPQPRARPDPRVTARRNHWHRARARAGGPRRHERAGGGSRGLDLRADLHMLMPFGDGPDAVPRAALGIVWHP
jgi:hypothetical protein